MAGVIPEVPILVGLLPGGVASGVGGAFDVRVIDFMNHPMGAAVSSPLTAQVLRYQLPVFFRWLAGRGKSWDAATTQDFVAYKAFRTRVDRVAGATWDKDHWALSRFYGWAVTERLVEVNPVPPRQRRERGRAREHAASKSAVSERWRWVTPGTFYGHATSIIGAGYGGMKQSGSTRFLPRETADHIAATLNTINSALDSGGGLSGPAAQETLNAASTFQGAILTSRDWKKILANPDIQTYDNPDSAVGCRFDPTTRPPCQNDTAQDARTEPDLANCNPNCANRFYTDQHASDHERKARELDAWADLAPEPEAVRLHRTADEHRVTADRHWRTRIGVNGTALPLSRPPAPRQMTNERHFRVGTDIPRDQRRNQPHPQGRARPPWPACSPAHRRSSDLAC